MKIETLSVSFVWTRTFFSLFDAAENSNFKFLALCKDYKNTFRNLSSVTEPLTLPWEWEWDQKQENPNHFWRYYLQEEPVGGNISSLANRCWEKLVPFRISLIPRLDLSALVRTQNNTNGIENGVLAEEIGHQVNPVSCEGSFEGFFYRHGVALICNLTLHNFATLPDAVNAVLKVRYGNILNAGKSQSFEAYCKGLLESLCIKSIGKTEGFTDDPFSLAAVVEGDDRYKTLPIVQGTPIHCAIEGLTSFNMGWSEITPPDLASQLIPIKNQQSNHLLYGHDNGRVLWSPIWFVPDTKIGTNYSLKWYYRNLLIASMHTKSLASFLVKVNQNPNLNNNFYMQNHVNQAIEIIKTLRNGKDSKGAKSYRTRSLEFQIRSDNALLAAYGNQI